MIAKVYRTARVYYRLLWSSLLFQFESNKPKKNLVKIEIIIIIKMNCISFCFDGCSVVGVLRNILRATRLMFNQTPFTFRAREIKLKRFASFIFPNLAPFDNNISHKLNLLSLSNYRYYLFMNFCFVLIIFVD